MRTVDLFTKKNGVSYAYSDMATRMRLELTTSSVTGWRSNQLNYRARCNKIKMVGLQGLEPRTDRL